MKPPHYLFRHLQKQRKTIEPKDFYFIFLLVERKKMLKYAFDTKSKLDVKRELVFL